MRIRHIVCALLFGPLLVAAASAQETLIVSAGRQDNLTGHHSMREGLEIRL